MSQHDHLASAYVPACSTEHLATVDRLLRVAPACPPAAGGRGDMAYIVALLSFGRIAG